MNKRFLRSPKLRNILFRSANGRCENCGQPLQDGWHADHTVPYVVTGRTNLFEMDALCPRCNVAKGASMPDSMAGAIQIDLEPMRPGVRGAINALWGNVRAGKPTTGIVLPTRYGKSDVIKLGGLGLLLDGLASYIVVLEPATILAQQILDPGRMAASAQRYNVPPVIATGITRWVMNSSPRRPFPPRDVKFVSLTVQMANLNAISLRIGLNTSDTSTGEHRYSSWTKPIQVASGTMGCYRYRTTESRSSFGVADGNSESNRQDIHCWIRL